jgi:XrtJ-associated TM-motif-TM protein
LEIKLKKIRFILPLVLLVLVASVRAHAQDGFDGCTESPENPTAVLGLIVAAAGFGSLRLRHYLRTRNNSKQK